MAIISSFEKKSFRKKELLEKEKKIHLRWTHLNETLNWCTPPRLPLSALATLDLFRSSAPLPPTPTTGIADPSGSDRLLHLLVRKPGLLAWIDFSAPIRSGERRWTARPVSWRSWSDTDPMPCLGFTTVLCLLSRRLFWRIRFLFFSGCLGRRSWNRRRSGMCCDVSAQILVFRIPRHLSIFVKRGLLLPQQIALYWHDTETLMYCIHSHASNVLYSFTCFFVVMVPIFWNRVISCCIEIMMMVN